MSQQSAPAFQFYPRDFLASEHVRVMNEAERGIYITLLCVCWLEGSLPLADAALVKVADTTQKRWNSARVKILACFDERDGRYYNRRLDLEREKQEHNRQQRVNAGIASVQRRFNGRSTSVQHPFNSSSATASASSIASSTSVQKPPKSPKGDDGFEAFWTLYPNKTGKGAAVKAWAKIHPNAELRATINAAVSNQRTWDKWMKDAGQFIPHPATWLNQQRWLDEPPIAFSPPCESPEEESARLLKKLHEREARQRENAEMGPYDRH